MFRDFFLIRRQNNKTYKKLLRNNLYLYVLKYSNNKTFICSMKPNGKPLIAYGKIRRQLSSVRPGASDRRECGTEGATSVFTALSTRLTLRLSALIILIHPSPLHPLRRTPALNTFPLLMLVIQFPHQQLLIHFRMHYINILLRRMVLSAFQKYLAQRIDYNSSFEYIRM